MRLLKLQQSLLTDSERKGKASPVSLFKLFGEFAGTVEITGWEVESRICDIFRKMTWTAGAKYAPPSN